jgi:DNA-binding response OmpR family regulator
VSRQEAAIGPDAPVLVVDPSRAQRELIQAVVERAGFRSQAVSTGEQALEAVRREPPQVVVLEVRLADISGYEVCVVLREEFGDAIGIVFVSGDRTDPDDRVTGLSVGADEYLAKPLEGDELQAALRRLARRPGPNHLRAIALREAGLTARELELLHLLAEGHQQHANAERLSVAERTLAKHIEHILAKLPARSRAQAVAIT